MKHHANLEGVFFPLGGCSTTHLVLFAVAMAACEFARSLPDLDSVPAGAQMLERVLSGVPGKVSHLPTTFSPARGPRRRQSRQKGDRTA